MDEHGGLPVNVCAALIVLGALVFLIAIRRGFSPLVVTVGD